MYGTPTLAQQEGRKRAESLAFGAVLSGLAAAFSWVVFAVVFTRSVAAGGVPGMTDVLLLAVAVTLSIATAVLSVCAFVQRLHNEQVTELETLVEESRRLQAERTDRSTERLD